MTDPRWSYPPELAVALSSLGLAPTPATPPTVVRAAVNDLYRFELKRARARLRRGEVAKSDYLDVVIALRRKYWMLSMNAERWEAICGEPSR